LFEFGELCRLCLCCELKITLMREGLKALKTHQVVVLCA
jgi:hypothetical protein